VPLEFAWHGKRGASAVGCQALHLDYL